MNDERKPLWPLIVAVLFALPVLYVLSSGLILSRYLSLNSLGRLVAGLFIVSLFATGFILAQLRRKPRMYTPYVFLLAIVVSAAVDLTGIIYWEKVTEIEWIPLVLLSGSTFFEYTTRKVHQSHFWTALCTCIITIAWRVGALFASAVASV